MPTSNRPAYEPQIDGLATAVANCKPDAKHKALAHALGRFTRLQGAKLATTRGGAGERRLAARKVLAQDGTLLHEDHREWLREQLLVDAGSASATYDRLRRSSYLLTECAVTSLHLVVPGVSLASRDFLQVDVDLLEERVDRKAFGYAWGRIADLNDLADVMEQGDILPDDQRTLYREPVYSLGRVIDVSVLLDEIEQLDVVKRERLRSRTWTVTHMSHAPSSEPVTREITADELMPGWQKIPDKHARIFQDWDQSSAGRSGERLCDHWVLQVHDWTHPKSGERTLSFIPMWTFGQKLAGIESRKGDEYTLYGKLQTLSNRVKVPFGWYFYMLHGNKVHSGAAERVLEAAESGLIVMPEYDYQVLKRWNEHQYGF